MSYDEQPDGDPHGECAAEIRRLEAERDELLAALRAQAPVAWIYQPSNITSWEPSTRDGTPLYFAPVLPLEGWQPIETAPKVKAPMIVVRGVLPSGYVTDPWCVWWEGGCWQRWPHADQPTHWMSLPALLEESRP